MSTPGHVLHVLHALALAVSYLVGSVSFATLLVRWSMGVDVRERGSGNAGATNVARTAGRGLGSAVLLLDLLKGTVAVFSMRALAGTSEPFWLALAGLFAVVGHVFPVFFGFRGGKGVATALGAMVFVAPWATLASLAVFALVVPLTRYVSLGSILGTAALPLAAFLVGPSSGRPQAFLAVVATLSLLLVFTHRANLARLIRGTERKLKA